MARIVDNFWLDWNDVWRDTRPLPKEMTNQGMLRILEVVADRAGVPRVEVLPIPLPKEPERKESASRGSRSIAFDSREFPLSAFYLPDGAEDAARAIGRLRKMSRSSALTASYWAGLDFHAQTVGEGGRVADMRPQLLEGVLSGLVRRGGLKPLGQRQLERR
jgi:hypothetical protein